MESNPWGIPSPPTETPITRATSPDAIPISIEVVPPPSQTEEEAIVASPTSPKLELEVDNHARSEPELEEFNEIEEETSDLTIIPIEETNDDFDDDDFGEMGEVGFGGSDDDFGDFEDTPIEDPIPIPTSEPPIQLKPSSAIKLDLSNLTALAISPQLIDFFTSLYPNAMNSLTDERERQVDGVAQVLVTDSLRTTLSTLSSLPPLRPLDWRRSRIRREHLITLGIPINLDDSAESAPLASLVLPSQISLRPSTAPSLSVSTSFQYSPAMSQSQSQSSRPSTPASARYLPPVAPSFDRIRADEIIKMAESDLLFMRVEALKLLQAEVERLSREASGLLTFELMRREKEVADGETYGALIADLVAAAAKLKTTTRSSTPTNSSRWGRKPAGSAVR